MNAAPLEPGLPAERTMFAWRRTALSVCVGGCFIARLDESSVHVCGAAVGAVIVASAGLIWVSASRRDRRRRPLSTQRPAADGVAVFVLAAVCASVSMIAVAWILTERAAG